MCRKLPLDFVGTFILYIWCQQKSFSSPAANRTPVISSTKKVESQRPSVRQRCLTNISLYNFEKNDGSSPGGGGGTSMFSVPGMCRWTGYSFHHSCSRAGYRFLQKCSQKGILFSNFCSQTGLQCIFVILCSQTGCRFLPFCSQTGVFKLKKMLPDRVKITAPQRHTPGSSFFKFSIGFERW